jgi:hypothetical protein
MSKEEEELAAWNVVMNIELEVKRAAETAGGLVNTSYYPGRCVALFGLLEVRVWYEEKEVCIVVSSVFGPHAEIAAEDLLMAAQHLIAASMFISAVEKAFKKYE